MKASAEVEIHGSKFQTDEFRNYVFLNGEGGFIPEKNRGGDPRDSVGCFSMFVDDEALHLLTHHGARMLADGKLYPRKPAKILNFSQKA